MTADSQRYLQIRAITIQYLRMVEDELIAMGAIKPQDRACITREERRRGVHVDIERSFDIQ
jgi:hypothetical protein